MSVRVSRSRSISITISICHRIEWCTCSPRAGRDGASIVPHVKLCLPLGGWRMPRFLSWHCFTEIVPYRSCPMPNFVYHFIQINSRTSLWRASAGGKSVRCVPSVVLRHPALNTSLSGSLIAPIIHLHSPRDAHTLTLPPRCASNDNNDK